MSKWIANSALVIEMEFGIERGAVNGFSIAAEDAGEIRSAGWVAAGGTDVGGGGTAIKNAIACRGSASG